MGDWAIRAEGLSKRYHLGKRRRRHPTLAETLAEAVKAPGRRLAAVLRGQATYASDETIWALREVTFEVPDGQVIGIIGRNGAGKTTLLKVLSRITNPTEGWAELRGRVGSLLEVGTGFHPELSGRENIYLSAAILGMRHPEIEARLDSIVAFAEVERFVDTPIKHYSSGMYLRLAFSVAAHLEPEILLIDEVLAVGDASFQRKCLGKLRAALRRPLRRLRSLLASPGRRSRDELDLVMSVEGQIGRAEARALVDLARQAAPGSAIVELGSHRGRSAVALALGARRAGVKRVYAIDPHEESRGVHGGVFGPADQAALYANLARTGLGETISVVALPSADVASAWSEPPVSLLFVDGDHRYEAVRRDWESWRSHLAEAATVAFHDSDSPGVARLLDELPRLGEVEPRGRTGSLSWFRTADRGAAAGSQARS